MKKSWSPPAGRKQVVGRPILYRTTRDFLIQFGLDDLGELPSLKEFEELARASLGEEAVFADASPAESEPEAPQAGAENA